MTNFNEIRVFFEKNRFSFIDELGNKKKTKELQKFTFEKLKTSFPDLNWEEEAKVGLNGDKFDVYGENKDLRVIIEFDNHRGDQISKKFVSRLASILEKDLKDFKVLYVIYLYRGTENSKLPEAKKYIDYCKAIGKHVGIEVVDYHTSDLDEKWGKQ
ncbi:TPA: hypothetical protein U1C15_000149 [Streptococcus suis]|nr:hypothetical protein [Streptococcus suis]